MIIKRSDVLQAIQTEPLFPGHWVRGDLDDPACQVCAVGAVLRKAGLDNGEITRDQIAVTAGVYGVSDNIKRALLNENYLGALSIEFERLCEMIPLTVENDSLGFVVESEVKPKLRAWVLENLPDGVIYRDEW